ncbi:MAG: hypothetical protein K6U00_02615 [Armatimonadetes bacterium]|nr:hypothetical protein [Armatimonadota bacterium]
MPEVQTVNSGLWGWAVLLFVVLGLVQVAIFSTMLKRYHNEQILHIEAVAMLIVTMQPTDIAEHSRRVATVSEILAREMGLPTKRMPLIRAAGLLHHVRGIDRIPGHPWVEAEILTVADHLDEVTHNCRGSMTLDSTIEDIRREVGSRFHPAVVKALMKLASRNETREM